MPGAGGLPGGRWQVPLHLTYLHIWQIWTTIPYIVHYMYLLEYEIFMGDAG